MWLVGRMTQWNQRLSTTFNLDFLTTDDTLARKIPTPRSPRGNHAIPRPITSRARLTAVASPD